MIMNDDDDYYYITYDYFICCLSVSHSHQQCLTLRHILVVHLFLLNRVDNVHYLFSCETESVVDISRTGSFSCQHCHGDRCGNIIIIIIIIIILCCSFCFCLPISIIQTNKWLKTLNMFRVISCPVDAIHVIDQSWFDTQAYWILNLIVHLMAAFIWLIM
jgi:hypothetical protein